jgi:hypothetical protein
MAKTLLADYVKTYDGVLTADRCDKLIKLFEKSPHQTERRMDGLYSFVEIDVTRNWPDRHNELAPVFINSFNRYKEDLDLARFWPARFFMEHLRLKRYRPGGNDSFPLHVDAYDSASAARFMTALIYLNAPSGGETEFPDFGISIAPAPGKIAIFPPLWVFPHAGLPPQSESKYILHTYLLYPPPDAALSAGAKKG